MEFYTVKEVAKLTGVTIKTLYHYHKVGLLEPCKRTEAGYRLYSMKELERLQQILFYRELDFSLENIKKAMENESSRIECLKKQYELLTERRNRTDRILKTIYESISYSEKGEIMDKSDMFKGLNQEEWREALTEQNEYLKEKYDFDLLDKEIQTEEMNRQAVEAQQFHGVLIQGIKNGWKADDEKIQKILQKHIEYLNDHVEQIEGMDARSFLKIAKFMVEDDFHRDMLENQQLGLAYYLYTAAELYAAQ